MPNYIKKTISTDFFFFYISMVVHIFPLTFKILYKVEFTSITQFNLETKKNRTRSESQIVILEDNYKALIISWELFWVLYIHLEYLILSHCLWDRFTHDPYLTDEETEV